MLAFTRLPLHRIEQQQQPNTHTLIATAAYCSARRPKIKLIKIKEEKITKKCNFRFWFEPFQSSITRSFVDKSRISRAQLKTSANWILLLYTRTHRGAHGPTYSPSILYVLCFTHDYTIHTILYTLLYIVSYIFIYCLLCTAAPMYLRSYAWKFHQLSVKANEFASFFCHHYFVCFFLNALNRLARCVHTDGTPFDISDEKCVPENAQSEQRAAPQYTVARIAVVLLLKRE